MVSIFSSGKDEVVYLFRKSQNQLIMSKDKGVKNIKKAPADKSLGKQKPISDYKKESGSKQSTAPTPPPKTKG